MRLICSMDANSGLRKKRHQERGKGGEVAGRDRLKMEPTRKQLGHTYLRPPCMHRIFSSIMAETGRQLNASVKVFQSLML
jgi:hypothetical protein